MRFFVALLAFFMILPMNSARASNPARAPRDLALAILEDASKTVTSSEGKRVLGRLARALQRVRIYVPESGRDFKACSERPEILAYAETLSQAIFACARLLDRGKYSNVEFAQVLIHEASHLAGSRDECVAAREEVYAMKRGTGRVPLRTGHMFDCRMILSESDEIDVRF